MNYERREEIFSKEILRIEDLMELTGKAYSTCAALMRKLKRNGDRLNIEGCIHVNDYLAALGIDPDSPGKRYMTREDMQQVEPPPQLYRASVCVPRNPGNG